MLDYHEVSKYCPELLQQPRPQHHLNRVAALATSLVDYCKSGTVSAPSRHPERRTVDCAAKHSLLFLHTHPFFLRTSIAFSLTRFRRQVDAFNQYLFYIAMRCRSDTRMA